MVFSVITRLCDSRLSLISPGKGLKVLVLGNEQGGFQSNLFHFDGDLGTVYAAGTRMDRTDDMYTLQCVYLVPLATSQSLSLRHRHVS